jgi:hypothetical protein
MHRFERRIDPLPLRERVWILDCDMSEGHARLLEVCQMPEDRARHGRGPGALRPHWLTPTIRVDSQAKELLVSPQVVDAGFVDSSGPATTGG